MVFAAGGGILKDHAQRHKGLVSGLSTHRRRLVRQAHHPGRRRRACPARRSGVTGAAQRQSSASPARPSRASGPP